MNSSQDPVDLEELKNCLKEAGLYENNMDVDDMKSYYQVIKSSENTAKEEIEHRNSFNESSENVRKVEELQTANISSLLEDTRSEENCVRKAIQLSVSSKEPTTLDDLDDLDKFIIEKNVKLQKRHQDTQVEQDNKLDDLSDLNDLNAYDCAPNKHKPLEIITHYPKYSLPIYCQPEFLAMDFKDRKRILIDSHIASLEKFYNAHCKSINPIQYGKPIMANAKFNGSLDRKVIDSKEEDFIENMEYNTESPDTEIYTSRSGRQTKRKLYNENFCDDTKKSKKNDNTVKVVTKSPPKRQNISKLSNQEIVKRSKLFSDSPRTTRAEKMFDILIETDVKKKQEDKEKDRFKESLKEITDDEDVIDTSQESVNPEIEIKPKEMPCLRRRVSPPSLRGRRGINNRTNSRAGKSTKVSETEVSQQEIPLNENSPMVHDPKPKSTKKMAKCPICSDSFVQDDIEEHASSCGLGMETKVNFENISHGNKIKCNICDMEMVLNTDYELHVKECLAQANSNSRME